jgi:DNA-directed RNA polymerase subunit omega
MIEELKEDEIVNKVGGRFKLATLIQKRMIALNQGSRLVVEPRAGDKMTSVIAEIMEDKIHLDLSGQTGSASESPEMGGDDGGTVDLTQAE